MHEFAGIITGATLLFLSFLCLFGFNFLADYSVLIYQHMRGRKNLDWKAPLDIFRVTPPLYK